MSTDKLPHSFFQRSDTVGIARELLGKRLYSHADGKLTGGTIVETEAYVGREDKACHAHLGRRTKRTQIMYAPGGVAYIYLCYGIHHLFNIVTNVRDEPHAVLVRALEPQVGIDHMLERRGHNKLSYNLAAGPGSLTRALGISVSDYGEDLCGSRIWLSEQEDKAYPEEEIIVGPRVGIPYAEEHAKLPWRFRVRISPWVSRAK